MHSLFLGVHYSFFVHDICSPSTSYFTSCHDPCTSVTICNFSDMLTCESFLCGQCAAVDPSKATSEISPVSGDKDLVWMTTKEVIEMQEKPVDSHETHGKNQEDEGNMKAGDGKDDQNDTNDENRRKQTIND